MRCGDADACVLFIFDLLTRAADRNLHWLVGISRTAFNAQQQTTGTLN